jgi:hypothetical protein
VPEPNANSSVADPEQLKYSHQHPVDKINNHNNKKLVTGTF